MLFEKLSKWFWGIFSQKWNLVFCRNFPAAMETLGLNYYLIEWRLFIDSLEVNLKFVFLYNGNWFPSIPLTHVTDMEESYKYMKLILEKVMIWTYWDVTWTSKRLHQNTIVSYVSGTADRKSYYKRKIWLSCESPGENNVEKIKNHIKTLDRNVNGCI